MKISATAMHVMVVNGREIPVDIRVNRRARRYILKVDPFRPAILLTCPSQRQKKAALAFAGERRDWIAQQLSEAPAPQPFVPGARIPVRGIAHEIVSDPERRRSIEVSTCPSRIIVGGDRTHLDRRLKDWLRREARKEFADHADVFCTQLGVDRRRISVRDTKTRWGSCSSGGTISFSWRLIFTPQFVYKYVIAHEVAHLRHMNHSAAFWQTVDSLVEDREEAESWLKVNGTELYAYGVRHSGQRGAVAA
ncbi:MAG: M48 family metallopeptidase [Aquisalinus sp.]|nr:M48 family metallopeptidase [Aquisalinus sp.]